MHKYVVGFYYNTDERCSSIVEASGEVQALAVAMAQQKVAFLVRRTQGILY